MSDRTCVECGRLSLPNHHDGWMPGEYCLFGTLYVCSVACARTYAVRESRYGKLPDADLVDPAMEWEYAEGADDGDQGTLCETTTPADVEAMRVIRNSSREFMTHDTYEIDKATQLAWFSALDRKEMRPYVFRVGGAPIGYGLVRRLEGRWWLSGGLLPPWRGRGYGRRLFAALVAVPGATCWLDVRRDNVAARRTYEALGFVEARPFLSGLPPDNDDPVVVMRHGEGR
jgi:ribosomal protein S18 acetylase RimI-like enzyme